MRLLAASLALGLCAAACTQEKRGAAPGGAPDPAEPARSLAALAQMEHSRRPIGPAWDRLAASPFPEVRRALALALGRASFAAGIPILGKLLSDPEPAVRGAAAFALGCYEGRSAADVSKLLLARLREEVAPPVIADLVIAFARGGTALARLVIERALVHPLGEVRAAGGLAAGRLAVHPAASPRALVPELVRGLASETDPAVRRGLAFGLARLGGQPPAAALSDRDPLVRAFAATGAGRVPGADRGALLPLLRDDDWRVRVAAMKAIARTGPEGALEVGKALKTAWLSFAASHDSLKSERVQVVLGGIDALEPVLPAERKVIEEVHWSSDVRESVIRYKPEALTSLDAVNCAAARALDAADGVPRRVLSCGEPRVFDWVRKRLAAQVLARTRFSPPAKRIELLTPLMTDRDPRVRTAAALALRSLWNAPGATALLRKSLRTRDAGVVGALAEVISIFGGRDPDLEQALLEPAATLASGRDAEAMIAVAKALGAVGSPKSAPLLRRLALDPVRAVAEAARESHARLFPADPRPPSERAPMSGFPPPVAPGPVRVAEVHTTKGSFRVKLHSDETPLTVGNFIALAKSGFYRRRFIHRVEPAFVVQMGDPRGDGTGGPGYALPCELTPRPYRRGSVGMALAGRDTGGSQFFVTHIDTPHLDGAYTLFGQVVEGMAVVESLVEGDMLLDVTVEGG
jgi:cyclophilin family peptidyl-prolyl cis-trans isomerase